MSNTAQAARSDVNAGEPGAERRIAWVRGTLLAGSLLSMIISAPVWFTNRPVPLLPIIKGLPAMASPLDKILYAALLASLVLAFRFYRRAVIFFLAASFFAYCQDQNRGQPWLYMYWVMLLLALFPAPVALAACRFAVSASYIWGGLQKMQPVFFERVPDWFVEPAATRWHFAPPLVQLLSWFISCAPFFELFIGAGLWTKRFRKAAIIAAFLVHGASLLFLGPLGRDYNAVIWPWNAALVVLILALFGWETPVEVRAEKPPPSPVPPGEGASAASAAEITPETAVASVPAVTGARASARPVLMLGISPSRDFALLRKIKPAFIIVGLYSLLPLLSYFGQWDSYFSFTLYAENQSKADIFVSEALVKRLPPAMRRHVHKLRQDYNPQYQGPFVFDFQTWGYQALRVPPIMETRNYLCLFKFMSAYAQDAGDLRMIVRPRFGPVTFYQGDIHLVISEAQGQ